MPYGNDKFQPLGALLTISYQREIAQDLNIKQHSLNIIIIIIEEKHSSERKFCNLSRLKIQSIIRKMRAILKFDFIHKIIIITIKYI